VRILGIGAAFSALPVLIYQGGIALATQAVDGLLIGGIGFNFLGVKEIRVANLIPAIFIPCIWMPLAQLVAGLTGG
jgi:uncharacterized membrane protein YqgA involved in biofilm formation